MLSAEKESTLHTLTAQLQYPNLNLKCALLEICDPIIQHYEHTMYEIPQCLISMAYLKRQQPICEYLHINKRMRYISTKGQLIHRPFLHATCLLHQQTACYAVCMYSLIVYTDRDVTSIDTTIPRGVLIGALTLSIHNTLAKLYST